MNKKITGDCSNINVWNRFLRMAIPREQFNKSIKDKKTFPFAITQIDNEKKILQKKKKNLNQKTKYCTQQKSLCLETISLIIKLLVYAKLLNFTKHVNRSISYL